MKEKTLSEKLRHYQWLYTIYYTKLEKILEKEIENNHKESH